MILNGLTREQIVAAGLGWILDDPADDDKLVAKIIERLMALPVGEVVTIKDPTKIPHIKAANRSAMVYNAIEIDETACTFTKVRECRIHRLAPYMGGKPLKIG
jgi:hypothetical protein